nr:hypothetical protein [Tanacetum cinerariifolium]
MSTQQDIYVVGSESRPPMLNKENYVPWSSRLLRYAKSRPNGKLINNSILNGPYVRKMISEPGDANREITVTETFHLQTNDELSDKELKQIKADDQAIQTILLGLPEDIYAAVDKKIASNLKFLNNLQPEWSRHVTIVHQTKDLHIADYTQLYEFLKYNQKEVYELKAEQLAKIQDPLALMANSNNPYAFPVPHQDQSSFNQNYLQQNYVSWSSRLLRYAKSRPNEKLIHNSILNGPYVRRRIPEPGDANREVTVTETFHVQTDDELSDKELKQSEHNVDFHPIVDFVEASHLMYALTFKPTVYVSYIRQFWSIDRIETTEEGTKILATIDGNLKTVSESSIRRNLKLNDEAGISSLLDAGLFENLTQMDIIFLQTKSLLFKKSEGSGTPTEPYHTPSSEVQQTSPPTYSSPTLPPVTTANIPPVIPTASLPTDVPTDTLYLRHYTRRARIAQSSTLPPVADELTSPLRDVSQGEACPTGSSLDAEHDKANIAKTSTLPHESTSRVPSLAANEGTQELEITMLKARVKLLKDKEGGVAEQSGDDAPIKGRRLDEGEEAAEKGSNEIEEMINVFTSMDATTILLSGVAKVPTGSGSISTAGPPATGVPIGNDVVPTAGLIFATTTVIMIDGLDRSNETIAKYLQEYHQFAIELPIERRIELISDLVRYQDNYAKAGWKAKDFKGMTLEEIKENFNLVWNQIHDFIPTGSKEEAERFKRKGIRFEQETVKKLKTSEEVKATKEVPEEKLKEMIYINIHASGEGLPSQEGSGDCDGQLQASSGELLSDGK